MIFFKAIGELKHEDRMIHASFGTTKFLILIFVFKIIVFLYFYYYRYCYYFLRN